MNQTENVGPLRYGGAKMATPYFITVPPIFSSSVAGLALGIPWSVVKDSAPNSEFEFGREVVDGGKACCSDACGYPLTLKYLERSHFHQNHEVDFLAVPANPSGHRF